MFPMVLISLDGWGYSPRREGNAIANCGATNIESLAARWPNALLSASGLAVGLPAGQMGNSEVGHTCMGAGRTVLQDLMRITRAVESGEIARIEALTDLLKKLVANGRSLHLMGLTSDGGVHSHIDHARGLVRLARDLGVRRIYWHAFLDGRDTSPRCALAYLESLAEFFRAEKTGCVFATVMGRFHAMDRDNRWERIEAAYRCMTEPPAAGGAGWPSAPDAATALAAAYDRGEADEFVKPTVIVPAGESEPPGLVRDGDGVIFFNFRADRARQMTRAFTDDRFTSFTRRLKPALTGYLCMTRYDHAFGLPVIFPPATLARVLGQEISAAGLRQLRIAETEKYAHVTFFFNGGEERVFPGEERILIPSPRVATYDKTPAMSAGPVTDALLSRLRGGSEDLVVVLNFANADMVGHTGVYDATVKACKYIDECVGRIAAEVLPQGGTLIVTADHGNAEQMIDPLTGGPHTAHTLNPVPVIIAGNHEALAATGGKLVEGGTLADIGPTMLALAGLAQPVEMTGSSLLAGKPV